MNSRQRLLKKNRAKQASIAARQQRMMPEAMPESPKPFLSPAAMATVGSVVIGVMVAVTGLGMTSCNNGNGTEKETPEPEIEHLNVTRAGINFRTAGYFTQTEIDAIAAELAGLTDAQLAPFTGYVVRWTRNVAGGLQVTLEGAAGSEKAIINSSSGTILENLTAGKAGAQQAREDYLEAQKHIGTWGGVKFRVENIADKAQVETAFESLKNNITEQVLIDMIDGRPLTEVIVTGIDSTSSSNEPIVNGVLRGRLYQGDLENGLVNLVWDGLIDSFSMMIIDNTIYIAGANKGNQRG